MSDILTHLQQGILTFLGVVLLITLINWFTLRRLSGYASAQAWPRVSILLPARNEAHNITPCVTSLLAQDYPNFEVLVMDDASTDGTGDILKNLAAQNSRLKHYTSRPLPTGWLGKHWACQQLAQVATGDFWLFTDADTVHHPLALRQAVAALQAEGADLITGLPHQDMRSWGERFIVSVLSWSLFCFYPMALAERLRWPRLVMAIGQFMIFRREAYDRIGGHEAVRANAADDIALAQRLVAQGGRWKMLDAGDRVTCRMYQNFGQAFQGFSKNLYAAFGYNDVAFLTIWLWLGLVFLAPFFLLLVAPPALSLMAIAGAMLIWGLSAQRLRLPLALACLYPISIALTVSIAFSSILLTRLGKAKWKGRLLVAPASRPHRS